MRYPKTCRELVLFFLLLLLLSGRTALAESAPRIYDDAGLFTEEEREEIDAQIRTLQEETGMDYAVATTRDAEGKSSQAYADDLYEQEGIGTGASHDGMLYLIDLDHGEIYISTEGEMLRYLTDERLDRMLDHAYEDAADEAYAESACSVLQDAGSYYAAGIPEGQYHYDPVTGRRDPYEKKGFPVLPLLFGTFAGALASLCLFFSVRSRYRLTRETYHYPLSEKSRLTLTESEDRLVNQFVTHRRIPRNTSSSSGGSRSSRSGRTTTHRSGSGRTHGGRGRRL